VVPNQPDQLKNLRLNESRWHRAVKATTADYLMKRADRVKLSITRNWNLPGTERLSRWIKPSDEIKVTLKNGVTWLKDEDIAIYTSADSYIEYAILSTGTYENEISKLIKISVKPGFVALDIGGNIGVQSVRMSQCAGSQKCILLNHWAICRLNLKKTLL
jgi:hypothetical protein